MRPTRTARIRGSVFGAAFGDAAGRPTEFLPMGSINARRNAPVLPTPALVTDDTEMMLAVGRELTRRTSREAAGHKPLTPPSRACMLGPYKEHPT